MDHRVDLIDSPAAIGELAPRWRALAELSGNPFVTPEWFDCAREHLDQGWAPAVIAVTRPDGELRGLLPFVRSSNSPRARMKLAGAGLADLLQPVAMAGDEAGVARTIGASLAELGVEGPLELGRVDSAATWWRQLGGVGAKPARVPVVGPADPLPYLSLPPSWDAYRSGRSRGFRSQLSRKLKSLQREHEVVVRRSGSREELEADLAALLLLHGARWQGRSGSSEFLATRDFQVQLARATFDAGWVRLYVMELDGEAAAAWYGWRLGERTLYYQAGFEPRWSTQSVGFLLLAETIKGAIEEGCTEYDMLLGDEGFKARFADRHREGRKVTLARPASASRLRAIVHSGARHARRRLPKR